MVGKTAHAIVRTLISFNFALINRYRILNAEDFLASGTEEQTLACSTIPLPLPIHSDSKFGQICRTTVTAIA